MDTVINNYFINNYCNILFRLSKTWKSQEDLTYCEKKNNHGDPI